jgi:anti-sigma factor RsiW
MNEQEQLKLQAYLDGELAGWEREQVATMIEVRDDARALLEELQHTRAALRQGEPDRRLDCTREFYWSGVEQGIQNPLPEPVTISRDGWFAWLRQHLAPVAGAVAAAAVLIVTVAVFSFHTGAAPALVESEWEVLHPNTGMVNFRDYQNGVTVVMLYDRSTPGFTSGD